MPPRSSKMKRFIFGFQRRVWGPECTPASRRPFMETTATIGPFGCCRYAGGRGRNPGIPRHPRPEATPGRGTMNRPIVAAARRVGRFRLGAGVGARTIQGRFEVGRQRRLELDSTTIGRMVERERVRVEELTFEPEVAADAVHRVSADRQPDRLEVDADLVGTAGLEPGLEQRPLAQALLHLEPRDGV